MTELLSETTIPRAVEFLRLSSEPEGGPQFNSAPSGTWRKPTLLFVVLSVLKVRGLRRINPV